MRRALPSVALLALLAVLLLPAASAANDPGHDSLYVLRLGDTNVTGSINLTGNVTATFVRFTSKAFGDHLDIVANGTVLAAPSIPRIMGATSSLYIDSTGNLYLNTKGGTTSTVQIGDTATNGITLNVSGTIRQQNVAVCLSNGTNCISGANSGNVSTVTAGDGLTDSGTPTDPVLDIGAGDGISVNADDIAVDATVCRSDGSNCPASGNGNSGWTNTSTQVYLINNATNVTVGSTHTLFIDNTNGRVGVGTSAPAARFHVNGSIIATGNLTASGLGNARISLDDNQGGGANYLQQETGPSTAFYVGTTYVFAMSPRQNGVSTRPYVVLGNATPLVWNIGNTFSEAYDTAITHTGAGNLRITNGTGAFGNLTLGTLNATQVLVNSLNVCLSDGTNCPSSSGSSGWTNTTNQVYLANNATNVSIGNPNTAPTLFIDNTNGRVGINTSAPEGLFTIKSGGATVFNITNAGFVQLGGYTTSGPGYTLTIGSTDGSYSSTFTTSGASTQALQIRSGHGALAENYYIVGSGRIGWGAQGFGNTPGTGVDVALNRSSAGALVITNGTTGRGNLTLATLNSTQVLVNNLNVCLSDGTNCPSAGGNISSSTTSTDNAVARWDSTTGTTIQNSAVTIDDTGNIFFASNFGFTAVTANAIRFTDNTGGNAGIQFDRVGGSTEGITTTRSGKIGWGDDLNGADTMFRSGTRGLINAVDGNGVPANLTAGRIGVGTTALPAALNVNGTANISGTIYQNSIAVCLSDGTNCPAASGSGGWLNTTNQVYLANNATNVTTGSSHTLFIDNTNGRVGVGTRLPTETLHVNSSGAARIKLDTAATASDSSAVFSQNGVDKGYLSYIGTTFGGARQNTFELYTVSGVDQTFLTGASERLRIKSTGNVGIGTANPNVALSVLGGLNVTGTTGGNTAEEITLRSGNGAAGDPATNAQAVTITGGTGGADERTDQTGTGGFGGDVTISAGAGGDSLQEGDGGTGGDGGDLVIEPGAGGSGDFANGNDGQLRLAPTHGTVTINNKNVCLADGTNCPVTGGNVSSSTTSTDNAVVRWHGTGGNVTQTSAVTIDDTGNIFFGGGFGFTAVTASAIRLTDGSSGNAGIQFDRAGGATEGITTTTSGKYGWGSDLNGADTTLRRIGAGHVGVYDSGSNYGNLTVARIGIGTTALPAALNVNGSVNVTAGNITTQSGNGICFNPTCTSRIYYNGSATIIEGT